jgi:hypothetical protein
MTDQFLHFDHLIVRAVAVECRFPSISAVRPRYREGRFGSRAPCKPDPERKIFTTGKEREADFWFGHDWGIYRRYGAAARQAASENFPCIGIGSVFLLCSWGSPRQTR